MYVVKVPGIKDSKGITEGCKNAGNAILEAFKEIHANESGKTVDTLFLDLEEIHLDDSKPEEKNKLIYENSFEAFETKPKTVFLGGDHSISYPLTNAFLDYCKKNGKEPCLIVFDAHPDFMPVETSGRGEEHPNHGEWLKKLVDSGFPEENILLVGIRNPDPEELKYLKESKITVVSMNRFVEDFLDTCDFITEFANGKELYVSIDIDAVDPGFAPGTGYKEPGGLTSREFIYIIQRINKIKNLKALDIVEINPEKDINGITVKLGAKILSELI